MYAFIYPSFFHYFFMTALFELCPRFVFCFSALGFWFCLRQLTRQPQQHLLICQIQAKTTHVRKYCNKKILVGYDYYFRVAGYN